MLYLYIGLGVLGVFVFLLAGFIVSLLIVTPMCYKRFFRRREPTQNALADEHYAPFRQTITDAKTRIENLPHEELYCTSFDGTKLYARYYGFGKDKTVIFMHGVYSNPLNNFAVIAERFIEWGYNVLMPDERAHGKSGGDDITYGHWESRDLMAWIALLRAESDAKIVLYGTSMGAVAVAFASDKIEEKDGVCAAVCDCGFTSMANNMRNVARKYHAPSALFKLMNLTCRRKLAINLKESAEEHLKNSAVPTLFVHGLLDTAVAAEESRKNFNACAAPKELILVEGCGHTTAAMDGAISQKINKFIKNYI